MFQHKKILLSSLLSSLLTSNSYGLHVRRTEQILGDEGCTYVLSDIQYEKDQVPTGPSHLDGCILSNGQIVEVKGLTNEFKASSLSGDLLSGKSIIRAPGAPIQDGVLTISDTSQLSIESLTSSMSFTKGTKKVLVIRADAPDAKTTSPMSEISDEVFGTSGDQVNLKSLYAKCSYNELKFEPATGTGSDIQNGVGQVDISTNVNGVDNGVIRDAMRAAADLKYGNLYDKIISGELHHVMFCIPPGTSGSWIAYAYVNSWLSVYNDDWCNYPSGQMHELGHNIGLAHSGETSSYDDQSGMMGYSYGVDEGPSMCFNAAKNWQLGWYEDARLSIAPTTSNAANKSYSGRLIGLSDYGTTDDKVMIQITGYSEDYYVSFNRRSGINFETYEGGDQVLVHSRAVGQGYATSTIRAKLNTGQSYSIEGSGTTTITVNSIDTNASPGFAYIEIVGPYTDTPTPVPVPTTPAPVTPTISQQPTISEIILSPNNLIDTISNPPKEFVLTFELYPNGMISNWGSILRYTGSSNNCCNWPDRWLMLIFWANTYTLHFVVGSTVNGNNYIDKDGVQGNMWNQIKVTAIEDKVSLFINGNFVGELPNTNRSDLPEVKVYAGDAFHQSANAKIRSLSFVPLNLPTSAPVSPPPTNLPTGSPTHTSREDFLPTLAGFCVTESGSDQNSGVIKLADGDYGPSEDKKMECVDICNAASVSTVTGCEAIWDQSNRGCYVHTQEVARGNGVDRHSCWVLSSTPPNVPTMYPTHRAPSPYPTEVPPTPYPTGKKCASLFEPCKKHNDCCEERCNKVKGICRK